MHTAARPYTRRVLRTVVATRYVTPLREGGSVPALVEADDDGLYVVKLLGAGHGRKALVAELIAGELARHLDLPVPDLVLVELDGALAKAEPDGEIQDLLERSAGTNFGLDFLPGALAFAPTVEAALPTRTSRQTSSGSMPTPRTSTAPRATRTSSSGTAGRTSSTTARRCTCITRGPSRTRTPGGRSPGPRPRPAAVRELDPRRRRPSGAALDRGVLDGIVASIPDDWLRPEPGLPDPDAHRAAYVDYLLARLEAPRAFVEEAERARAA